MNYKIFLVLFFTTIFLNACKNYYNETIHWADEINVGTDIETVKKSQPSFVKILWGKPIEIENEKLYEIIPIENDILNMSNFLVFVDDKYQGRESKK